MTEPAIDFTQLPFPSDNLTVAALRKAYPYSFDLPSRIVASKFDTPREYGRISLEETLGGVIDAERMVASMAFKQAMGLPPTESEAQRSRETLRESLASEYVTLGLAAGEHHADQLIRHIEAEATTQARSHPGHPR
jgi:hypothetical protein